MTLPPIVRVEFKHYIKKANKCYQMSTTICWKSLPDNFFSNQNHEVVNVNERVVWGGHNNVIDIDRVSWLSL